jgi:NAD(P)H-dependent flavin oxidoreductase YrpB (nitropropane dioxygenase family)
MFSTSITRTFGLTTPIVNAGMAMIARPALAAAVCEAGGLGTISSDINPPDRRRQSKRPSLTRWATRPLASDALCRKGAPLGQSSRASLLVDLPRDEMALLIEVVVDLGMN